jgi:Asp-tRNA(Asn)/Glu-tRNA(Gln) amidotransferase A subunit family amidase
MTFRKSLVLLILAAASSGVFAQTNDTNSINLETVSAAESLLGLKFSEEKNEMMLGNLRHAFREFDVIRNSPLDNSVPPAMLFNPIPVGMVFDTARKKIKWSEAPREWAPARIEEVAFDSIGELAALIKSRQITSEQLTRMYLERLKKYGPKLLCVVTLTEERALEQARRADAEIAAGKYRGLLHGIPYGVKDLLATKGIRTTWGAAPFTNQIIDSDATVVKKLDEAGAVLIAKLTLGELAMGDVWFGGKTRNPWDIAQGSSGSSAGPASATAAGLVAFAIGSETHGSIVSPCTVCGVTGLRPTYGRVSRTGAMALSWSMDKLGPICRTVEDCAIVFDAIRGPDGMDQTLYDLPFNYQGKVDLTKLRIGYLKANFEKHHSTNDLAALDRLRALGARLVPIELPKYPHEIELVLDAEAAAAFDTLTRDGQDDLLARQTRGAWPDIFRRARFIPVVEYIEAQRIRRQVIQEMAKLMSGLDVYVTPSVSDDESLLLTNLTGNPQVVVPDGFSESGHPQSISFVGRLFDEATLLGVAKAYQDATGFHLRHPAMDWK